MPVKTVLVTGAAGQIAYSLLPLIARGEVCGPKQEVKLVLLDISQMMGVLQGVVMELQDCAYPLVTDVIATDKVDDAFQGVDVAFLVGAMPRREGMERRDLLKANVKIFKEQGQAMDKHAKRDCRVLVVGNPANTNALICSHYAPSIPRDNFTAMTRLDQNRASGQIAERAKLAVKDTRNVVIWGNHSSTQFPDARFCEIQVDGKWVPLSDKFRDAAYLQSELVTTVQKRGAAVIAARKLSSAMSAARAAADHMRDWLNGTPAGTYVSMGVISKGEYGVPEGLMYSFPVTCSPGKYKIVEGLAIDDFAREKMRITTDELVQEKSEAFAACQ